MHSNSHKSDHTHPLSDVPRGKSLSSQKPTTAAAKQHPRALGSGQRSSSGGVPHGRKPGSRGGYKERKKVVDGTTSTSLSSGNRRQSLAMFRTNSREKLFGKLIANVIIVLYTSASRHSMLYGVEGSLKMLARHLRIYARKPVAEVLLFL